MRYSDFEQTCIIEATSYAELEKKFNQVMYEMRYMNPHREILEPRVWAVFWSDHEEVGETELEKREIAGTEIRCKDCPHFKRILNQNGTENRATKHAVCTLWDYKVLKKGTANDECYEVFNQKGGFDEYCKSEKPGDSGADA